MLCLFCILSHDFSTSRFVCILPNVMSLNHMRIYARNLGQTLFTNSIARDGDVCGTDWLFRRPAYSRNWRRLGRRGESIPTRPQWRSFPGHSTWCVWPLRCLGCTSWRVLAPEAGKAQTHWRDACLWRCCTSDLLRAYMHTLVEPNREFTQLELWIGGWHVWFGVLCFVCLVLQSANNCSVSTGGPWLELR